MDSDVNTTHIKKAYFNAKKTSKPLGIMQYAHKIKAIRVTFGS